ncbi:MAG: RNA 2',3'-cyclic phosphodiesterase, partial [Rubricoccaceae bacterium]|nr:RNA 2',3'-cyclic phosphodiesterase [Rubricoccaceae bacterium]
DNVHLTLHFLGDVEDARVPPLGAALAALDGRPFSLAVEGLGAFPSRRAPRVLVARTDCPPGLSLLHAQVGAALRGLGHASERRPFRPHLTLARLRQADRQGVRAFLVQPAPALSFPVEAVHLIRSTLRPEGARYERLHTVRLGS